ncbi:PH domain-containing protein [Candidatus Berkelbacteria bacterium]|nr:PH domain-containing protein [Candidatus Berkelbacteria bacterium]
MTPIRNVTTGRESDLFPGQYEHEEVLIFIRRHWVAFAPWLVITLLMLTIPAIVLVVIQGSLSVELFRGAPLIYVSLGTAAYLLFTSAVFLTAWIEHYLDVTILTPERLINIFQVGLFNRKISELNLMRVQDVSAQISSPIQAIFRYGTVVVESAGEAPNFVMRFVPKPHVVANTILVLHDQLLARSGTSPQGGEQPTRLQAANTQTRAVRDDLAGQMGGVMGGVHPPTGYDHNHFSEDLITQAREAQQHVAAEHRPLTDQAPPSSSPASSPNRLPPQAKELQEGETVEL